MVVIYLPKTTTWNHLNDLRKNSKTAIFEVTQNLLSHPRYSQYDLGKFGAVHKKIFLGTFASEEEAKSYIKSIDNKSNWL